MPTWAAVLIFAGIMVAAAFLVSPVLVYLWASTPKWISQPSPRRISQVENCIERIELAFVRLGFGYIGQCTSDEPDCVQVHRIYHNRSTGDVGHVRVVFWRQMRDVLIPPRHHDLMFVTEFADGLRICTVNTWPWRSIAPIGSITCIPQARTADVLYRVHELLVEQARRGRATAVVQDEQLIVSRYAEEMEADQQRLVARGLQRFYEKSGRYRPTWKGALGWGAQNAWPVLWVVYPILHLKAMLLIRRLHREQPRATEVRGT